jgi:hypothetical protein
MAEQTQTDPTEVAAGAPNILNIKNKKFKNKNRVEIQQDLNGANFTTTPTNCPGKTKLVGSAKDLNPDNLMELRRTGV